MMTVARTLFILSAAFALSEAYYIKPGPLVPATRGEAWPKPQKQERGDGFLVVRPQNFKFQIIKSTCKTLQDALDRYRKIIINTTNLGRRIGRKTNNKIPKQINWTNTPGFGGFLDVLDVELTEPCPVNEIPDANMQERYTLNVNMPNSDNKLQSKTVWGVLRGLETFSQILYLAETGASDLIVNSTSIKDYPRFHYRGLHLDTARHFQPMFTIKQILDAMSYNKMNVFHWHIVDDQSFPYQSRAFPELSAKGAYHPEYMVYTPEDVQKVIKHAAKRGIRVIPEYDSPGHTRSWGEGRPELLTECYSRSQPNGYLGPIDPTRNTTYDFLRKFFDEIVGVFPEQYVHLGGDEVDFDCWESNPNINKWMLANNMAGDYAMLEDYYIKNLLDIVDDLNASSIVWEEVFANGVKLPIDTVVHVWLNNEVLPNATNDGHRTIWSQCWYLDHLSTGGDWKKYYQCDPHTYFDLTPEQEKLVIGGEACMWAEVVDATNVVQRIWPRASAVAEKLWSAKSVVNLQEAAKRLEEHTCRMNMRGIPAQPPNGAGFCI